MRFILALIVPLFLAGCLKSVSTMYKMRNFNIETTDAARLRAAVRFPQSVKITQGQVSLAFLYWHTGSKEKQKTTFILKEVLDPSEKAELKGFERDGYKIKIYRIAPSDLVRIATLRKKFGAFKKQHKGANKGSIAVGAKGCRSDPAQKSILISSYFKSQETGSYVVLIDDYDMLADISADKLKNAMPLCS